MPDKPLHNLSDEILIDVTADLGLRDWVSGKKGAAISPQLLDALDFPGLIRTNEPDRLWFRTYKNLVGEA